MAMPIWLGQKLWLADEIERELAIEKDVLFGDHHESHAASAFYPSPFEEAAVLTIDGVGEWTTSSVAHGNGAALSMIREMRFPHSVGLLYSAFTYFTGFKVNEGEYKIMGLAPYGQPTYVQSDPRQHRRHPRGWQHRAQPRVLRVRPRPDDDRGEGSNVCSAVRGATPMRR